MSSQIQNFSVRKAQPEDAEEICQVHITAVRELCKNDYTLEQIEAWVGKMTAEGHRLAITQGSESFFVAETVSNRIIGFSSLYGDEIYAVYVHPEFVRCSVGRQMLEAVEAEAISQGMQKLKLSASTNAVPFYKSQDYQVLEYTFHTLNSGVLIPCVRMEKELVKHNKKGGVNLLTTSNNFVI